jgi:hypothetical protein
MPSVSNSGLAADPGTPTGSHLSALSRTSSTSNIQEYDSRTANSQDKSTEHVRVPFRWSTMKGILPQISSSRPVISSQKAAAILGSGAAETPTVMAANGLICIGTTQGRVFVFDFKQNLRTICIRAYHYIRIEFYLTFFCSKRYTVTHHRPGTFPRSDLRGRRTPFRPHSSLRSLRLQQQSPRNISSALCADTCTCCRGLRPTRRSFTQCAHHCPRLCWSTEDGHS